MRVGVYGFTAAFDQPGAFHAAVVRARAAGAEGRWPEIRSAARATALTLTWAAVVARFAEDLMAARAEFGSEKKPIIPF